MRAPKRISKAIAVVFLLGLGLLHNIDDKSVILRPLGLETVNWDEAKVEAEKSSESKLFVYAKSFIKSSIYHLISNI